jgi:predicted GIY-YIG superfamily endonuclease
MGDSLSKIDSYENYMRSCGKINMRRYSKMASVFETVPCCSLVYTLELEGDHFYVGTTTNANIRLAQHWTGKGSRWTKLHKPVRIRAMCMGGFEKEREVTLALMREVGWQKVRGGPWTRPKMFKPPSDLNALPAGGEAEVEMAVTDSTA